MTEAIRKLLAEALWEQPRGTKARKPWSPAKSVRISLLPAAFERLKRKAMLKNPTRSVPGYILELIEADLGGQG
jgi:hypothetical protein